MYYYTCVQLCVILYASNAMAASISTTTNYPIATTESVKVDPLTRFLKTLKLLQHSISQTTNSSYDSTQSSDESTTETLQDYRDEENQREGRGMMYEDHDHDHEEHHEEHHDDHEMKDMQEQKAVKDDPWAGYYDFIITEGSFKFWAVFQLVTAVLLIYSALAAVYYAKFNVITTDYDYNYYDFFGRSDSGRSDNSNSWFGGLSAQTFQRILDAISSKKYS